MSHSLNALIPNAVFCHRNSLHQYSASSQVPPVGRPITFRLLIVLRQINDRFLLILFRDKTVDLSFGAGGTRKCSIIRKDVEKKLFPPTHHYRWI